ncbi:MAG: DUF5615 family PIN-like protein [Bacteroidetes bacterium]|nr:DUF5615 family PIN-like protein [Bacteroidota bacterium]
MNLLFDQNLSYKLVNRLADVFPNASHIKDFSLSNEGDIKVWDFAQKNDFTIVTQDSDFYDLALVNGTPPKIVWIRAGNSSTKFIEDLMRTNALNILNLNSSHKICLELI